MTVSGVSDRPGEAALLFRTLADAEVNVDMIVQNVSADGLTDISFTLPHDQIMNAQAVIGGIAGELGAIDVVTDVDIARVSLVGAGMQTNPGIAATMFEIMAAKSINIKMISTSAIRISCVVKEDKAEEAVAALHAGFELEKVPEDRNDV